MGHMLDAIVDDYNIFRKATNENLELAVHVNDDTIVQFPCKVSNFTNGSYAKYAADPKEIIMEYGPFTR
jgi:hypothetical protein